MSECFGNQNSEIVFLFLPGWTTPPVSILNFLTHNVNKNKYWCILNQTFKGNQWFRYGAVEEGSEKNYNSFISHINLNLKNSNELTESINYISETIDNINKKVVLLGTSQGATAAFHYFHSSFCSEKVMGLWVHNMAGFYPEYLNTSKKYMYNVYTDTKLNDRHSTFDDDTFDQMNRCLNIITKNRSKRVFFYNSKNDNVIPNRFKKMMMNELFKIYNF